MPKSTSTARPSSVTRMLDGLRSRCTIPAVCAASSAEAVWATRSITWPAGNVRRSRSTCHSEVPSTYCIAMYGAGSSPDMSSP